MSPAVVVDGVSKWFHRGGRSRRGGVRRVFDALTGGGGPAFGSRETGFWALRNVSIRVSPGEALGIIGPNGAGKSTILKLLSGILRPTEGKISYRGRMAALIELGAGFHPELSGSENIRLNAAILGIPQRTIRSRVDEIAEFADLRGFMDTPVKHYSSGMTARLGFSVAAHVEPDILLIDEVLSVGDRVFRSRCADRMNQFLRRGAAIVFVSHDLQTIHSFCSGALLLNRGRAVFSGMPSEAIAYYQRLTDAPSAGVSEADAAIVVVHSRLIDDAGRVRTEYAPGEWFALEASLVVQRGEPAVSLVVVRRSDERSVARIAVNGPAGQFGVRVRLRANLLPGEYELAFEPADRVLAGRVSLCGAAPRFLVLGRNQAGGIAELRPQIQVGVPRAARF